VKYAVVTFGCRVNQADSLLVEEGLRSDGALPANPQDADVVVVNTCSVTASADQAARQTIRRIARTNPSARIVVTGCYATRRPDEVADLPGVIQVLANDDKPTAVAFIRGLGLPSVRPADQSTADRFGEGDGACGAAIEPGMAGRTAFTLRVQTGCAEQCSYCIIPSTRGAPRSLRVTDVIAEVSRVIDAGFKEIALTGVHLGSYGRDLDPPVTLTTLLRALVAAAARSDVLFRISSLEPMDCTPEVVDIVSANGCFAPHFHLPLQHASNRMLVAMRRPYTIDYYRALVNRIRHRIPNASIGSDIIVGFPGETDDDFDQLTSYLDSAPLTHVHVFPYSDRPGTVASGMAGTVHGAIVRERGRVVREIGLRLADSFRASQCGTVHRALTVDDGSRVVTGNYLKLRIPPGRARNQWVDVRVASHHDGEVLSG
jgi:threonylcarbamoyladenosine tRNA methylthiotransferase MtaB